MIRSEIIIVRNKMFTVKARLGEKPRFKKTYKVLKVISSVDADR